MSSGSQLLCAKCGAQGSGPKCSACGGEVVKVCPACRFQNSTAKNYCDSCGADIGAPAARRPAAAQQAPQAPETGTALPQAGRAQRLFEEAAAPASQPVLREADKPRPAAPPPAADATGRAGELMKAAFAVLAVAAFAAGATFFFLQHRLETSPEAVVPELAKRYLEALSANDYATAYGMLSEASRASCSLEEFRTLRDLTPWTWSDLELVSLEPDAVIMSYRLAVQGRPPIKDTLSFALEDGRWVRPYNWHSLKLAEEAFDRNDPDLALMKAGEAVRIDPRDPMARGYLCESVYYRKLSDRVEPECRTALELADRYPSKLSERSLYHLHAILADTYKTLRSHEKEAAAYGAMLAFPGATAQDRCEVLLARAEAQAAVRRPDDALKDLQQARTACSKPENLDYIRKRSQELSPR